MPGCSNTPDCLQTRSPICSQFAAMRLLNDVTILFCGIYLLLMRQDSSSLRLGLTASAAGLMGPQGTGIALDPF
jgi:hypothetical protein